MSSSFDWSKYEKQPGQEQKFDWSKYEKPKEEEENLGRTAIQGPLGFLKKYTWPADVLKLLTSGASQDVLAQLQEEEPELKSGVAEKARQEAMSYFPTQELAEELIEKYTDIPLRPKTERDRLLRTMGISLGFKGGDVKTKIGAALATGAARESLLELGVPEDVADVLAVYFGSRDVTPKQQKQDIVKKPIIEKSISEPGKGKLLPSPPPPPPPPPAGKIGPGTVLPETKSSFGEKEKIVEKLSEKPQVQPLGAQIKMADMKAEAPSLQGRVSEAKELGEAISKEPFETEAQAGRSIAREVKQARDAEKEIVRDKYKKAEEITQTHNDIYPDLARENEDRIAKLEQLEKRSAGEEAVYQDALTLRRMIGEPGALIEANANRLMKQANSFSQKVNYELPYTGYKGQIKEIVHQMNNAVISSLERAKLNAAAVKDADRTFARFADRFMGDEISPYLHKKILNPERLARTAISDEASYKAIKGAISQRTSPLINKIDRELLHKKMDKYYKNPELVNSKEYVKDLKNLAEKIGKEKIAEVDLFLRQKQISHERSLLAQNKLKETQLAREKISSKQPPQSIKERISKEPIAKTPEQIDKLFKSRSDIRRFRRTMKDHGLEKDFEKLAEQKVEEIFKEGGFGSKKITGKDLERIIDKEHEILSELLGEEELSALYKAAKIAGKNELTQDILKQVAKTAGKMTLQFLGLGKIIKLLPVNRI